MNWADWVIIAIFGLSVIIGMVRGFVREALSLLIWATAFIAAMVFHEQVSAYFVAQVDTPSLRYLIAWIVIFIGVLLAGAILNFIVARLVDSTGLSGTDRLLGFVFGGMRGFVVVMAILIVLPGLLPVTRDPWWHDSLLIPHFLRFEGWAREIAMDIYAFFKSLV